MTISYATINLTTQRLKITPALFGGVEEGWQQDFMIKENILEYGVKYLE